jgi:hypothetical protein
VFEKPKFIVDDATASDVRQGNDGDCWFLSALCAISNKEGLIDRVCVEMDEKVGVYGFVFHRGIFPKSPPECCLLRQMANGHIQL